MYHVSAIACSKSQQSAPVTSFDRKSVFCPCAPCFCLFSNTPLSPNAIMAFYRFLYRFQTTCTFTVSNNAQFTFFFLPFFHDYTSSMATLWCEAKLSSASSSEESIITVNNVLRAITSFFLCNNLTAFWTKFKSFLQVRKNTKHSRGKQGDGTVKAVYFGSCSLECVEIFRSDPKSLDVGS